MQEPITTFPLPAENKKSKLPLVIVIVIVALALGWWFFFRQSGANKTEETKITPTETQEPTPTEKPLPDKKTVKIQVLNGTGTPGQAGEAVKLLVDSGYETDNIKTGNADKYDHTTTTISFKEGFDRTADDVKTALKEKFDKIDIESTELDKDSEYDIVVTTGGKIFEEPTTTPSPTSTSTPTPTPTP